MLRALGQPHRTLSIVFVGAEEMRKINKHYLGRDYATDVLSFSYGKVKMDGLYFLGEIVIAPGIAVRQAIRSRVSPERELRKLLVHGALHLLGHDHEKDKGEMNRIQAGFLRRRFFLNPPPLTQWKVTG